MSAAPRRPRAASASAKSGAAGAKRARAASAESAGAPVAAAEAKPETATVEETGEAERDEAVPLEPEVLDVGAESAELPDFVPEAATPAETARAERALTVASPATSRRRAASPSWTAKKSGVWRGSTARPAIRRPRGA